MEAVLLKTTAFDMKAERHLFLNLFGAIANKLGESAFVKFRGGAPIGGLAPAYFEAVAVGSHLALAMLESKNAPEVKRALIKLVQSEKFRDVTGPGANTKNKLETRIELAAKQSRMHDFIPEQIEQDLAWREAEMGSLKMLIATSRQGQ